MRVAARGEFGFEGLFGLAVVEAGDALLALFQADEHLGQLAIGGGAGDERNIGGALEDALAFLLRDAAEDAEAFTLRGELLVIVEAIEDLLLCLVANGAGVVKDEV